MEYIDAELEHENADQYELRLCHANGITRTSRKSFRIANGPTVTFVRRTGNACIWTCSCGSPTACEHVDLVGQINATVAEAFGLE